MTTTLQSDDPSSDSSIRLTGNELASGPHRDAVIGFLATQPIYHFSQDPDWARANDPNQFVGIATRRAGTIQAWTLMRRRRVPLIRRSKYFGERGPVVGDVTALPLHVRNLAAALAADGLFLALHPYALGEDGKDLNRALVNAGFVPWVGYRQHYDTTLTIDLRPPLREIRASFRRSMKTQINKAQRCGIVTRLAIRDRDYESFAQAYTAAMKNKRVATPQNFNTLLKEFAAPPKGFTLLAEIEDTLVAGIALVGCGRYIVYQWGFTSQEPIHRHLPLHHALHWHAIRIAWQSEYDCYDLGGYWRQLGDENSINHFKSGLSPSGPQPCGSPLVLPLRHVTLYTMLGQMPRLQPNGRL